MPEEGTETGPTASRAFAIGMLSIRSVLVLRKLLITLYLARGHKPTLVDSVDRRIYTTLVHGIGLPNCLLEIWMLEQPQVNGAPLPAKNERSAAMSAIRNRIGRTDSGRPAIAAMPSDWHEA